jgi:hypothetical protein
LRKEFLLTNTSIGEWKTLKNTLNDYNPPPIYDDDNIMLTKYQNFDDNWCIVTIGNFIYLNNFLKYW